MSRLLPIFKPHTFVETVETYSACPGWKQLYQSVTCSAFATPETRFVHGLSRTGYTEITEVYLIIDVRQKMHCPSTWLKLGQSQRNMKSRLG